MGTDSEAALRTILRDESIGVAFQPIVHLGTGSILGHEALMRPEPGSLFRSPLEMLDVASRIGRLFDLERVALRRAVETFAKQRVRARLFLNLTPRAVEGFRKHADLTLAYLAAHGVRPSRIVLEITEADPIADYSVTRETLQYFRRLGFSFALDDMGAGYSGLRHLNELHPEYVKIDRHFIDSLGVDSRKRNLVQFIQNAAHSLNCCVIAEGVETRDELRVLRRMGVDYVQGYLCGRPAENCRTTVQIPGHQRAVESQPKGDTAASIMWRHEPVFADSTALEVAERFEIDASLPAITVVDNDYTPVGIVTRRRLQARFAMTYGRALAAGKAIAEFTERPIVVFGDQTLDSLSRRITESRDLMGDEVFVVVDKAGRYAGVGTLIDLLRRMTDLRVEAARHSNPLTGLPGNLPIDATVTDFIKQGVPFVLAYFDIDEFKSYNDRYGYAAGDDVLRYLADLIRENMDPDLDFAGHVGGDDFVVAFRRSDWEACCRNIVETFSSRAPSFYDDVDREAGGFWGRDRQKNAVFHPLISVSIGAVPAPTGRFTVHHELAHVATEVKSAAKKQGGGQVFIDRRGGVGLRDAAVGDAAGGE